MRRQLRQAGLGGVDKRLAIHVQRMRRSEELCASMQDPAVRKATEYGAVS
jgi:hypothetical protein